MCLHSFSPHFHMEYQLSSFPFLYICHVKTGIRDPLIKSLGFLTKPTEPTRLPPIVTLRNIYQKSGG